MNVSMDGRERERKGGTAKFERNKRRTGRDKMFISHADDFNMHANAQLAS
jgi:hypothetical protein